MGSIFAQKRVNLCWAGSMNNYPRHIALNKLVFYPPIIVLGVTVFFSLYDKTGFLIFVEGIHQWILYNFGWLFKWSAFIFLIIILVAYVSKLGKVRIGGPNAKPILTKWRWFSIAICTTVATGILFWGCAEPLYHLYDPPSGLQIEGGSANARTFAISTMFMHYSITPYGIYCITGLVFALVYYNLRKPFNVSSLFYPVLRRNQSHAYAVLDIVCLYTLVLGMASSLGTGILAMMGGLEFNFTISQSDMVLGFIGIAVVGTFLASAASGLQKGIKTLSNINLIMFFTLAIWVFLLGNTFEMLSIGKSGLVDFASNFVQRNTDIAGNLDLEWQGDWTIFYWAVWFAWAPVASLFLGRLSVGYTVRDFIRFNLVFPALFAIVWMTIFSGSTLHFDMSNNGTLNAVMHQSGEGIVMYTLFDKLPGGKIICVAALIMVFISYVTAADSNISAMSSMSTTGIDPEHPEAPIFIKLVWGLIIGLISWIMLTYSGIDGIRILSVLSGFPALFIVIVTALGLITFIVSPKLLPTEDSNT